MHEVGGRLVVNKYQLPNVKGVCLSTYLLNLVIARVGLIINVLGAQYRLRSVGFTTSWVANITKRKYILCKNNKK